ncbi:MAG: hypothetical protein OEY16_13795, partial [Alphaproteobacteria bacterium]|nr:hypothetical protein [Alphaproteobacteria bacterium]
MMSKCRMPVYGAILRRLALTACLVATLPVLIAGSALAQGTGAPAIEPPGTIDCRTLWSFQLNQWGEPGGDGSFPCVEYIPEPQSRRFQFGMPIRLYIPSWWVAGPHPEAPADTPEIIFKAMEKSFRHLQGNVDLYPVTAVLLPTVSSQFADAAEWGDAYADVVGRGSDRAEACPVSIYINSVIGRPEDDIGETVAHEIMHCIQFAKFRAQTVAAGARWWMEATATYFGDVVFECGTADQWKAGHYYPDVTLYEQTTASRNGLGYPAGIFFTDVDDEGFFNVPELIRFMGAMPGRGSGLSQEQALANWANMGEMLHRFGESFIDGSIKDCGRQLTLAPVDGPHEIAIGVTEIEVEADPFTIKTASVMLQKDTTYKIRVERQSTLSYGMVSFRDIEVQGGWAPLSNADVDYNTGCDFEPTLQFAVTTATGSGESFKARIIIEEKEEEDDDSADVPAGMVLGESVEAICSSTADRNLRNDCRSCNAV